MRRMVMARLMVLGFLACALTAHDAAGQGAGVSLRVGTDGDDTLAGTDGDDILDPLTAFDEDQVQGGPGDDILALPGAPQDYVFVAESAGFRITGPNGVNAVVEGVERVAFGVTGEQLAAGATPLTIAESAALLPGSSADGTGRPPIALSDTVGGARGASRVLIDLRDLLRNDYDPDFDAQDLTGLSVTPGAGISGVDVLLDAVSIDAAGFDAALYPFGLLVVDLASPLASDVTLRYRTRMTLQGTSFTDLSSEATVTITPVGAVNDRVIGSFGGETFIPYARLLANDGPGAVFDGIFNAYVFGGTILDDPARGGIVITFPDFYRNDAFFEYAIDGSPDRALVEVELRNSPPIAAAIARVVIPATSFMLTFDEIRNHFGNFDPDSERDFIVGINGPASPGAVTFQILHDRVELSFPAGYAGDFVLDYTLSDQPLNARSLPSTISFLTAAPPAPVAVDDVLTWGINSDGRTLFQGGQPGYGVIYSRELLANDQAMPGSVVLANAPLDTTPQDENLAIRAIQYAVPGSNGVTSRSDTAFGFEFEDNFTGSDTYAYTVVDPLGRTATGLITLNVNIPQPVLVDNVITIPTGATSVTVTAAQILGNDTFSGPGAIAQINPNAVIQVVDSGVSIGGGKTRLDGFTFDLDPTRSLDSYQFNVLAFDTEAAGGSASGWQVVTFAPAAPTAYRFAGLSQTNTEGTSTISDNGFAFRIERSGVLDEAVVFFTLRPAVSGPSADGSDVRTAFGTQLQYQFGAGQDAANLGVSIIGDALIEPDEVFLVTLDGLGDGLGGSNPGAIDPSASVFVATILNDDAASPPVFTLRVIENAMPEGTGAGTGGFIAFEVQRSAGSDPGAAMVTVQPDVFGPNPIDGNDLVSAFNAIQVAFAEGQTSATFSLQAIPDDVFEPSEELSVYLALTTLGTVDRTPVTAIIFNDDLPPPVFRLRLIENVETEGTPPLGGGFAAFGIERVSGAATAATLTYSVTPSAGAPVDAADLAGGFGDFTISMGEAVDFVQFSLAASSDARFEQDETYTVTLTATTAGTISATENAAEAIIFNDDLPPPVFTLTLTENAMPEGTGAGDGGYIAFGVARVSGAAGAATVTYRVRPGTALPAAAADDLLGGFGEFTIDFADGQDFVSFSLQSTPDTVFEPGEWIDVALVSSTLGTVETTAVAALIFNDDLPPTYRLQILHADGLKSGDAALANVANFAAIVDALEDREPNSLTLINGDAFGSGPLFNAGADPLFESVLEALLGVNLPSGSQLFGRLDVAILSALGVDAASFGNQDLALGPMALGSALRASGTWPGAPFPYLSANVEVPAPLAGSPNIAPSAVVVEGGERIGLIGLTTPLLESLAKTLGGIRFADLPGLDGLAELAAIVNAEVLRLTALNADLDKIVLLSHLQDAAQEQALIPLLRGIDIVLAGGPGGLRADATDVLRPGEVAAGPYPVIVDDADANPVALVSTDDRYGYVGRLVIDFDASGVIVPASIDRALSGAYATTGAAVSALWGAADPFAAGSRGNTVAVLVDAAQAVVQSQDTNILGRTDVYLEGRRELVRTEETNFGNLSADSKLAAAREADPTVQVAISNAGGIGGSIGSVEDAVAGALLPPQASPLSGKDTGEISQLDVRTALRFNNRLTLLTLNASELLTLLEHTVAATSPGATPGQFPQIAGLTFTANLSRPAGDRIGFAALTDSAGAVRTILVSGGALAVSPATTFRIATIDFLADGGDGYPLTALTAPARVNLHTPSVRSGAALFSDDGTEQDALAEYLLANFATTPYAAADTDRAADTRIRLVTTNSAPNAADDFYSTPAGQALNVPAPGLLANDTDADGDPIIARQVDPVSAQGGTVTLVTDGSFTYTPPAGFVGTDSFTYRPYDGQAQGNVTTVTVTVAAPPPPPCAVTPSFGVVTVTRGPIRYVRARARFEQVLTLTNNTWSTSVPGPLALALDGLAAHATLVNADGVTSCAAPAGSPYTLVPLGPTGSLNPFHPVTVVLAFTTTQNLPITYTTRVLAGASR